MPVNAPSVGRTDARQLIDETRRAHAHVVYFAHSLIDYGTQRERDALAVIRAHWPESGILNPSEWGRVDVRAAFGSYEAFYRAAIKGCDEVCVLEHAGHIGRGVFEECTIARATGKPVHVLRGAAVQLVRAVRAVDPNDWKVRYGRVVMARGGTH